MMFANFFQNFSDEALAGAFAGVVARFLTSPFDMIKIRMQLQAAEAVPKYTNMLQAFTTIVKEEGLYSLWKGNLSGTYLWVSYAMVQFTVYGFLKRVLVDIPNPFLAASGRRDDEMNSSRFSSRLWKPFMLFLAGAGAGIASTIATYPFDIMRTQFAMQGETIVFNSMSGFLLHTVRSKGIGGLYAGVGPAVVGITPYMGLNFAFYESLKLAFDINSKTNSETNSISSSASSTSSTSESFKLLKKGLCGGLAGGLSKFCVYPLDTVKKRMQAQLVTNTIAGVTQQTVKFNSISHCIITIMRTEGVVGFYRGLAPTIAKSILATAITFAAYEGAKEMLEIQRQKLPVQKQE